MEKETIFTGKTLKWIAILSMLIDHATVALLEPRLAMEGYERIGRVDVFTLYQLGRSLGRWAFPIFCFLLVEGFFHTRSRTKMVRNLCIFALISEIPFDLLFSQTSFFPGYQNIFFTLLLGYLGLWVMYQENWKVYYKILGLLVLAGATYFIRSDYGLNGYLAILIYGVIYPLKRIYRVPATMAAFYFEGWWAMTAFIPIYLYNGKRGNLRLGKYFFYIFYPAHLLILYLISYALYGGSF